MSSNQMPSNKRILFISHNASRTGAPIVLMHHLAALKRLYPDIVFDILLKDGGDLVNKFMALAPTSVLPKLTVIDRLAKRIFKQSDPALQTVRRIIGNAKYKVIYGNTVLTADLLAIAKQNNPNATTICHVHELEFAIKQIFGEKHFADAIPFIDHFVATSNAVKDMLITVYKIPENRIYVYHGHIPMPDNINTPVKINNDLIDSLKKSNLNICGSGAIGWTKGIDLFIQAAHALHQSNPNDNFHFYWIGGSKSDIEYEKAIYDIRKAGIAHRVTMVENNPDPQYYMQLCDIFFLSSREDSFPLVCLEAAALGKPIICFAGSGGMVEFVDDDSGWLINYFDFIKLNNVLKNLLEDSNRQEVILKKGLVAKSKVAPYDIEKGIIEFKSYLDGKFN